LGLSIAQDIAQLHGSALDLGRSDLGGLRVRLAFAAVQTIQA
jgi:signal transduction histidine kinase